MPSAVDEAAGGREGDEHLPPELLVPIMEHLARTRLRRTLLRLMLSSRTSYELGLPALLRTLSLSPGDGFDARTLRRFSRDFLGSDKFRHVRELIIGTELVAAESIPSLLPRCSRLAKLHVITPYPDVVRVVWEGLEKAPETLKEIRLSLFRDAATFFLPSHRVPMSVVRVDLFFEPDLPEHPVLAMLDRNAPGLKSWNLRSVYEVDSGLCRFPRLAAKLESARLDWSSAPDFFAVPDLSGLKDLAVTGLNRLANWNLWTALSRLENLEKLALWRLGTLHLPGIDGLAPSVRSVDIWSPIPLLRDDLQADVASAFARLASRGTRVRFHPTGTHWADPRHDGEREFLSSLPAVDWVEPDRCAWSRSEA
ncbi:hypothetical protein DFJ74DRAFT_705665 [Hyaloraphidium curvatum]|nr:hypothetical protein DFJ74DRAFT_705665 [Hyaloraphidium curvatum]